jgi:hypothetical protein
MHIQWVISKLRHDRLDELLVKAVYRRWACLQRKGRRRRWSRDGASFSADSTVKCSLTAARELWPGASDRSWVGKTDPRVKEYQTAALRRAEAAAQGRFDLLGSGEVSVLDERGRIQWHRDFRSGFTFPGDCLYMDVPITVDHDGADIKVPWELSRFQHVFDFIWAEDDRYSRVFLNQWNDWLETNPVARGVNWACTMDVALRAISWTAAIAAWGSQWDSGAMDRMGGALADHGRFIRDNLEWAIGGRTNHYFSDLAGLAVLGTVLPSSAPAQEWGRFAAKELRREILDQFASDGMDKECSTTYHRLMIESALVCYRACRLGGHDLGEACRQRLVAAVRAIGLLGDSSGCIPMIGDNDSGRVFPMARRQDSDMGYLASLGAVVLDEPSLAGPAPSPELAILAGPEGLKSYQSMQPTTQAPQAGAALMDSGLFVLGPPRHQMTVRCGPLRYKKVGGHDHLDQLSVTVSVNGKQLIVDPGQFCYTPWPEWRNRFRFVQSHNTVTVDGQQQLPFFTFTRMNFSTINMGHPRLLDWSVNETQARFRGRHSGYRRLAGGGDHEREIRFDAACASWTIIDRLAFRGRHQYQWGFHLHPEALVEAVGPGKWRIWRAGAQLDLAIGKTDNVSGRIVSDWYAPGYGTKEPAPALVLETSVEGPVVTEFLLSVSAGAQESR